VAEPVRVPISGAGAQLTPETAARVPLRFLIVDDERINLMVLRAILEHDGHRVIQAANGLEAVAAFEHESPDMVLMDVMMPVLDGYEAARRIKTLAGARFVPVIFLTALTDEQSLARCVVAGGDDFLTKPYSRVILRSKISALVRLRELYRVREQQHDEILFHHRRLQQEQAIAERIFSKVVHSGCLDSPSIRYQISPVALFNGDLLLAARRPSGGLLVLLGDFAGHGLPAALGTLPTAEIFYVMTAKGYAVGDIVAEINHKLKTTLPPELFLATCLLEIDVSGTSLAVWNGGIPDVLIRAAHGKSLRHLPSRHLPLGVVKNSELDRSVELARLDAGDRIYVHTDGLTEAVNAVGDMFGEQRLHRCLTEGADTEGRFEALCASLDRFRGAIAQRDDITLLELTPVVDGKIPATDSVMPGALPRRPAHWRVTLELKVDALRQANPLPPMLQLVTELQSLNEHRERIYMIVAEMFNNALEHGLLRLDSALKDSPRGFAEYYQRREQAIATLDEGWISIELAHEPSAHGGQLSIQVRDSGPGYARPVPAGFAANAAASGRGLELLRTLCKSVIVHDPGNHVEAVYEWP
jgi:CheY-like chemotaxis protein/serine phosphatase RsbU (regulator of sigma subunit)